MPHPRAPNQIPLTEQLYLFQSVASGGSPDCLIDAHGIAERSWSGLPMFTLPVGLTLQFYAPHGREVCGDLFEPLWRLRRASSSPPPPLVRGPALVPNYTLCKFESYEHLPAAARYPALHRDMVQGVRPNVRTHEVRRRLIQQQGFCRWHRPPWGPHVLTIRNRRAHPRTLMLGDVIRDVHRARPDIRNFHAYCCREETFRFDTWPWWVAGGALVGAGLAAGFTAWIASMDGPFDPG